MELYLELYYESKNGFLLMGGCFESSDFDKDTLISFNSAASLLVTNVGDEMCW